MLFFRLPQQHLQLGFDTYEQLPPIRAKRLESVVGLQGCGDDKGDGETATEDKEKMTERDNM